MSHAPWSDDAVRDRPEDVSGTELSTRMGVHKYGMYGIRRSRRHSRSQGKSDDGTLNFLILPAEWVVLYSAPEVLLKLVSSKTAA